MGQKKIFTAKPRHGGGAGTAGGARGDPLAVAGWGMAGFAKRQWFIGATATWWRIIYCVVCSFIYNPSSTLLEGRFPLPNRKRGSF
jgi:hypothetical protein